MKIYLMAVLASLRRHYVLSSQKVSVGDRCMLLYVFQDPYAFEAFFRFH